MRIVSRSLRFQLVLWNALILTALLAVLGVTARFAAATAIMNSVDRQLAERTQRPPHPPPGEPPRLPGFGAPGRRGGPDGPHPGLFPEGWPHRPHFGAGAGYELRFFNRQGQPRLPQDHFAWDPAALRAAQQGQIGFSTVTVAGQTLRVLTKQTPPNGYVQAAYPLTEVNRATAGLDRALLLLIPVALLAAGLGGALLTARVLRPVRQMTEAAAAMGDQPSARLPSTGEDEFAQMAATFNGLLERLDTSFKHQTALLEQQRRFTADASHELKSPLTVIQGTANQIGFGGLSEAETAQAAAEIAGAAANMARLVQDLLLLARSDAGWLGRNKITVLAEEVLAHAIARTARDGSPIRLHLDDPALTLCGNEDELGRLFANLLQNAAQSTPPDGAITLSARHDGEAAVISVTDTGVGIAPEHLRHLGERFYRTDSARARRDGGSGLGLSICRSIVEAHGGALSFASTPGAGTTVTVRLP